MHHFRAELFEPKPELRSGTSTATLENFPLAGGSADPPKPPPVHLTPTSEDDTVQQQDDDGEQVDASPRRPRQPQPPDLEDALTRLTQTLERMAAIQQRLPAADPAADFAEDPDFNWFALRSPLEATFPLPNTGVVQRIAAGLFAKLQAGLLTGRDQHEARFVLDMISDWEDMDLELRHQGVSAVECLRHRRHAWLAYRHRRHGYFDQ